MVMSKDSYLQATKESRHYKLAVKVLTKTGQLLVQKGLPTVQHDSWPYQIGVEVRGVKYSLVCGGFEKRIDIARLKKDGNYDQRFKEVSFMTPEGAANYMQKLASIDPWFKEIAE